MVENNKWQILTEKLEVIILTHTAKTAEHFLLTVQRQDKAGFKVLSENISGTKICQNKWLQCTFL